MVYLNAWYGFTFEFELLLNAVAGKVSRDTNVKKLSDT